MWELGISSDFPYGTFMFHLFINVSVWQHFINASSFNNNKGVSQSCRVPAPASSAFHWQLHLQRITERDIIF